MPSEKVVPINLQRVNGTGCNEALDLLAVEEPLEIRLGYGPLEKRQSKPLAVTMRTPGNDLELAAGFLFSENIISRPQDILSLRHCRDGASAHAGNVVRAELSPELAIDIKNLERHFYSTSSCGVCGKASIEAAMNDNIQPLPPERLSISSGLIKQLPEILEAHQVVFEHTGGLHAAALFDLTGQLIAVREDIGRHNALDKLIGMALYKNLLPLHSYIVLVSGRAGFELIQKSLVAGLPLLAAVGAPSSLAVQLAEDAGMTLIGFLREDRFNIYCGAERIM